MNPKIVVSVGYYLFAVTCTMQLLLVCCFKCYNFLIMLSYCLFVSLSVQIIAAEMYVCMMRKNLQGVSGASGGSWHIIKSGWGIGVGCTWYSAICAS